MTSPPAPPRWPPPPRFTPAPDMPSSSTHLVLLPSYNTGPRLAGVIREVLRHWQPVLVVIDGSTDGSEQPLLELARTQPGLSVLVLPKNSGKGAAVLAGLATARDRGYSHALVMDADGQHPAAGIAEFMAASAQHPAAMILGRPVFGADVPAARLHGRKISVGLVRLETLGAAVADPLYGFRVYPVQPLLAVLGPRRGGRRYDFDTEAAVRLFWSGIEPVNLPSPVKYFTRAEGGVSHFHYLRDNLTLVRMHTRLILELAFFRWPAVLRHRRRLSAAGVLGRDVAPIAVGAAR
ncbi:MAG: glycosyltransferase family 2 protein, partial [Opitutus sp.]